MITKQNLVLPNLFIGGVQKSGTTYLHNLLKEHPDVFSPKYPQEIHFFAFEYDYQKNIKKYQNKFRSWQGEKIIFQTSPYYLYLPAVPERIANIIPDAKFIFILRNPIDRAYSHYWHSVKYAYEKLSFVEAIRLEPSRIATNFHYNRKYSYLNRGKYPEQIERFYHQFGRENILIIFFNELTKDINQVLVKCALFLDIDASLFPLNLTQIINTKKNQSRLPRNYYVQKISSSMKNSPLLFLSVLLDKFNLKLTTYPPIEKETKIYLQDYFEPEINKLEKLIDQDLSYWLK